MSPERPVDSTQINRKLFLLIIYVTYEKKTLDGVVKIFDERNIPVKLSYTQVTFVMKNGW